MKISLFINKYRYILISILFFSVQSIHAQKIGEEYNQEFEISLKDGSIVADTFENFPFDVPFVLKGKAPNGVFGIKLLWVKKNQVLDQFFHIPTRFRDLRLYVRNQNRIDSSTWYLPAKPLMEKADEKNRQFRLRVDPLLPNTEYIFQFDIAYHLVGELKDSLQKIIKRNLSILDEKSPVGYLIQQAQTSTHFGAFINEYLAEQMLESLSPPRAFANPRNYQRFLSNLQAFYIGLQTGTNTSSPSLRENTFISFFPNHISLTSDERNSLIEQFLYPYFDAPPIIVTENVIGDEIYRYIVETFNSDQEVEQALHRLYYEVYNDSDFDLAYNNYAFLENFPNELTLDRSGYYGLQVYLTEIQSLTEQFEIINRFIYPNDSIRFDSLIQSPEFDSLITSKTIRKSLQDSLLRIIYPLNNLDLLHKHLPRIGPSYGIEYNTSAAQALLEGRYRLDDESFESPPLLPIGLTGLTVENIDKYIDNLRHSNNYIDSCIDSLRTFRRENNIADSVIQNLTLLNEVLLSNLQLVKKIKAAVKNIDEKINYSIDQITTDVVTDFASGMTSHSIGEYETRSEWYVSGDVGIAYVDFGSNYNPGSTLQPYFGVNFNLAPVNRQRHFNLFKSIGRGDFFKRPLRNFSIIIGLSIGDLNNVNEDERLDPLWGSNLNLLTGIGIRLYDPVRVNTGFIWVKEKNINPIIDSTSLRRFPFISVSFDIDVKERLGKIGTLLKFD